MRFSDHGGAAAVYKSGKRRGICAGMVLDFFFGGVGFLINGAQRARSLIGDHRGDGGGAAASIIHTRITTAALHAHASTSVSAVNN